MHDHEVTECICTDLLSFRCAWHFSFFFFVCVCVCEMLAAHFSDSLLSFLYASWNLNNEINRKDKTEAIWSAPMLKPKSMGQTRFRTTEEMENYFFYSAISRVTFQCTLYNNIIHQITYLFVIIITILSSHTLCVCVKCDWVESFAGAGGTKKEKPLSVVSSLFFSTLQILRIFIHRALAMNCSKSKSNKS